MFYFVSALSGFLSGIGLSIYAVKRSWQEFCYTADDNNMSPGNAVDKLINKEVTFDFGSFTMKAEKKNKGNLTSVN